jgi:hypothetical protein
MHKFRVRTENCKIGKSDIQYDRIGKQTDKEKARQGRGVQTDMDHIVCETVCINRIKTDRHKVENKKTEIESRKGKEFDRQFA